MEFKSTDLEIDIIGSDIEWEVESLSVTWLYETEARDWGVKGVSCFATRVEGRLVVDGWENIVDLSDWKIESDFSPNLDGSCQPQAIEIDFESKTLTIT